MFIGLDFFNTENNVIYQTNNRVTNMYSFELTECIIDKFEARTRTDVPFTIEKNIEWEYDSIANADFQGTLEAGNVDNLGNSIEYIVFKKRKTTDVEWQTVCRIPYETALKQYHYFDRLVQNGEQYEYAIVPMTSCVEGEYNTETVDCEFDGTWIVDKEVGYQLLHNLEYGDIEHVVSSTVVESFTQYPTIVFGQTDYIKSNIKAMILTDSDVENVSISPIEERQLRENIMKFLKNKKPKILKDASGRYYMIAIINPKETPNNQVGQTISGIGFDFVEIGNATSKESLENNNLI